MAFSCRNLRTTAPNPVVLDGSQYSSSTLEATEGATPGAMLCLCESQPLRDPVSFLRSLRPASRGVELVALEGEPRVIWA